MLYQLLPGVGAPIMAFCGIILAFVMTIVATAKLADYLPKDGGRAFAHDGKLSAGKPRGAGIIFVIAFALTGLLFMPFTPEYLIYLVLIIFCMITGFLDDAAKNPWGEYKKGFLDLCVAVMVAVTFLYYNSSEVNLAIFNQSFVMPSWLFCILTVVLVWTSVNVTNCADGVDGLSGTLTIITLMAIYVLNQVLQVAGQFSYMILLFAVSILGYLWYNATPSKLMMGDAGSRAMGLFIAIAILKTGAPFLYIPVAFVLIMDGGLGLLKVSLIRFLKIHIMNNIRTPLHDHVRKVWDWSNTQTVYRFAIIQIIIEVAVIYAVQM